MILSRVQPVPAVTGGLFFGGQAVNYREMLVEASRRYKELEVPAPLSWLDHKNA